MIWQRLSFAERGDVSVLFPFLPRKFQKQLFLLKTVVTLPKISSQAPAEFKMDDVDFPTTCSPENIPILLKKIKPHVLYLAAHASSAPDASFYFESMDSVHWLFKSGKQSITLKILTQEIEKAIPFLAQGRSMVFVLVAETLHKSITSRGEPFAWGDANPAAVQFKHSESVSVVALLKSGLTKFISRLNSKDFQNILP